MAMNGAWVTHGVTHYDGSLLKSLSLFPYKANIDLKQLGCENNETKIRQKLNSWDITKFILIQLQNYNSEVKETYEIRFATEDELSHFIKHYEGQVSV